MSDFEEYIKLNYPRDYERQKRIYPDQSMEDLYSEDYKMWQHQQSKIDELQKRVDAAKQLIEDLNKCYQQDHQNKFEYWRGFADSAGILGKRLEQALNGGNE